MAENVALQGQPLAAEKLRVRVEGSLPEQNLLKAAKKGNREAYGSIVKRYMKTAYFIALGFVSNQQDALDVSQEAFIRAFRKIKTFDTDKPFFPWFYRLMRNLCMDFLKRKQRRKEIPLEDIQVLDKKREDRAMKEALWKGINELSFEQREIIILRYFRQLSYAEIAEIQGKPLGTVMSSLYYAKKKLKSAVARYLGFE